MPIGFLWGSDGFPIGVLHNFYRVPMGFLQGFYSFFLWYLCHSSSVLLSFLLSSCVLLPLPSCPSSSVLLSFSQFPLVVLVLLPLPPYPSFCRIPDSYKGCCRIPKGFLQAFYRVPTGFSCVYQVAPHTRFKHISKWRTNHHMKFHTQWHMNMSVSWLRWQHMLPSTRLETRTKDSNICASSWVSKLTDIMQAHAGMLALATDQLAVKCLTYNICATTRKMVNYAWEQWIQGKLWWRFVAVVTCKYPMFPSG